MDGSWLSELGKFLDGEENNLKDHKKFYGSKGYTFVDKSFPTVDQADDLIKK
jgi:hypothetical protein